MYFFGEIKSTKKGIDFFHRLNNDFIDYIDRLFGNCCFFA